MKLEPVIRGVGRFKPLFSVVVTASSSSTCGSFAGGTCSAASASVVGLGTEATVWAWVWGGVVVLVVAVFVVVAEVLAVEFVLPLVEVVGRLLLLLLLACWLLAIVLKKMDGDVFVLLFLLRKRNYDGIIMNQL